MRVLKWERKSKQERYADCIGCAYVFHFQKATAKGTVYCIFGRFYHEVSHDLKRAQSATLQLTHYVLWVHDTQHSLRLLDLLIFSKKR